MSLFLYWRITGKGPADDDGGSWSARAQDGRDSHDPSHDEILAPTSDDHRQASEAAWSARA